MFTTAELTVALLVIPCQLCSGVCKCIICSMADASRVMMLLSVMSSYCLKICNTINIIVTFLTALIPFGVTEKFNRVKLFLLFQS